MSPKNKLSCVFKLVLISIFFFIFLIDSTLAKEDRFNMSYLYFGDTETFIRAVHDTNGSIDTIAPSYFDLNEDGTLDEKVDPLFVEEMKKIGVKVVPFLSNHWDRELGRKALSNTKGLVKEIVDAIDKYNLDGVNIDLENLNHCDRENYTNFVKMLYNNLPEEKEVSIAVAANPWGSNIGWQGSYDYYELAKYCDYLMIMTYDESYYGSLPGPVASIDFVEDSIQYALTQVPANKIVLGIAFYGRYWKDGELIGGVGIPNYKVDMYVEYYNGTICLDNVSKSPFTTFNIPYGGTYPNVNGRILSPGDYTIWYENEESIKTKLDLVDKYDLLGTGSWSLSNASEGTWDYYLAYLNGEVFTDIDGHWAKDDIIAMVDNGWMIGASDNYFLPNVTLTRAQATVVLVRALGLVNNVSESNTGIFKDVSREYWASSEIDIAFQNGIIEGKCEGVFAPNEPINRAEMAVMLARIFYNEQDLDAISQNELNIFTDVSDNHWAVNEIKLLNKEGIFKGYSDGKFHIKNELSRAEMAALMNRVNP